MGTAFAALLGDMVVDLIAYGTCAFIILGFFAALGYLIWQGLRGKIDYDDTP